MNKKEKLFLGFIISPAILTLGGTAAVIAASLADKNTDAIKNVVSAGRGVVIAICIAAVLLGAGQVIKEKAPAVAKKAAENFIKVKTRASAAGARFAKKVDSVAKHFRHVETELTLKDKIFLAQAVVYCLGGGIGMTASTLAGTKMSASDFSWAMSSSAALSVTGLLALALGYRHRLIQDGIATIVRKAVRTERRQKWALRAKIKKALQK